MDNKEIIYNNMLGFINSMETAEIITKEQAEEAREYAHTFVYSIPK